MSNKVWDEERIREEFKKLDSMTGLHGADLPITFGKAKHTLGCFYIDTINKKPKKFLITHNQQVNPINEINFTHKCQEN